jgi:Fe2+ transport system protein FeoA
VIAAQKLPVVESLEPPHQGTAGGAAFGRPVRLESPHQGTAGGAAFGRPVRLERETCPLCQAIFNPSCANCSTSCPLSKGCAVLTCPSCGYSFPKPTGLSAWLARFFAGRRARAVDLAAPRTLASVDPGVTVRVERLHAEGAERDRLSKLAAFGIVEGCEIKVRQTRPALILEVGETTLALDAEVARTVWVAPVGRAA